MIKTELGLRLRRRQPSRGGPAPRSLGIECLESRWLLHAGALAVSAMTEGEDAAAPDFELVDQNPHSSTYQQNVSPRDYLQQVSGWYFTYAT